MYRSWFVSALCQLNSFKLTALNRSGGAYGVSAGVSSIWQRTKSDATQVTAKEGNREIHAVYNVRDI